MADDDRTGQVISAAPHTTGEQFTRMLRGALLPTLSVAVVCVAVAAAFGAREAWSAALGAAMVVVFFSASLLVMRRTAHLQPTAVMAVVLGAYTAKVVALGVVMVLLRDVSWLAGPALGLTVVACTLVWLGFEMRAFTRLRVLVTDAPAESSAAVRGADPRPS